MSIHRIKPSQVADLIENTPGKHPDGGGLYLQVASPGNASWVWRHKEVWRSIGPASVYTIDQAREIARKLRLEAHEGRDPFQMLVSRSARPVGATFAEALTKYLDKKQGNWAASNRDKERRDHERTFTGAVGSVQSKFSALPIKAIDPAAKQDFLEGLTKSARRKATNWIEAVIRYAETGVILQRGPSDDDDVDHHDAMPWAAVPAFYAGLPDTVDANALRFLILTGARTDEIIGAKKAGKWTKRPAPWSEIVGDTWVIPKTRYKTRKEHQVPLSEAAVALLGERQADDVFLFKASSDNALLKTLRKTEPVYVVHGFRSSFEDWAAETTAFPADLVKRCTGHDKRSKTDKAYQRSALLVKRREVMLAWSNFVAPD